jgi:hypothetical protein
MTFLYGVDYHTSEQTNIRTSTAFRGGSLTFAYVDYARTSQQRNTYEPPSTITRIALFSFVDKVLTTQEKHIRSPGTVAGMPLFLICRICSYLTGNIYTSLHDLLRGRFYISIRRCYFYHTGNTNRPHSLLMGKLYFSYFLFILISNQNMHSMS